VERYLSFAAGPEGSKRRIRAAFLRERQRRGEGAFVREGEKKKSRENQKSEG